MTWQCASLEILYKQKSMAEAPPTLSFSPAVTRGRMQSATGTDGSARLTHGTAEVAISDEEIHIDLQAENDALKQEMRIMKEQLNMLMEELSQMSAPPQPSARDHPEPPVAS